MHHFFNVAVYTYSMSKHWCTHSTCELLVNEGRPQRTAASANYNTLILGYLTPWRTQSVLCKIFSFLFFKGNLEDCLWYDDILTHDFREPQGGQYLSCQENTHKVLQQMPLCPKSSISRLFRLVMEQNNNALAEDTGSKRPSNQSQLRMFKDIAGPGVLPTSFSWSQLHG